MHPIIFLLELKQTFNVRLCLTVHGREASDALLHIYNFAIDFSADTINPLVSNTEFGRSRLYFVSCEPVLYFKHFSERVVTIRMQFGGKML